MSRLTEKFNDLKVQGRAAFIPYIAAGDPNLDITKELLLELQSSGSDIIELGIPFSDPIADGPTIQKAGVRALNSGTTVKKIYEMLKSIKKEMVTPLVLMTYFNPVLKYGIERFIRDFKEAGVDGIIVPDLPPDEADDFIGIAERYFFDTIFLLAPTSNHGRIKRVSKASHGYIYYVSVLGVTGARASLSFKLSKNIKIIKKVTKTPVCVGFGISTPEQVSQVASMAEGVIVGSAIIKVIENNLDNPSLVKRVGEFTKQLVSGIYLEAKKESV